MGKGRITVTQIASTLIELRCVLEDMLKDPERREALDRLPPDERARLLNIPSVTEVMLEDVRRHVAPSNNGFGPDS
jgi:hypothetical protein